jgi:hypothetical protein
MSSIEIYAELLNNIRAVTLVVSLQSESNQETNATLSADGQMVTISHESISASIRLPTQMTGGGTATLALPAAPAKDLTLRLQLQETAPGLLKLEDESSENIIPWSAPDLDLSVSLLCKNCNTKVLRSSAIREWRDLPSENWAEMMDFWHCHKPHDDRSSPPDQSDKGYSASNQLRATPSIGFIAPLYFVFTEQDCTNVVVSQSCSAISRFNLGEQKETFPSFMLNFLVKPPIHMPYINHQLQQQSLAIRSLFRQGSGLLDLLQLALSIWPPTLSSGLAEFDQCTCLFQSLGRTIRFVTPPILQLAMLEL